MTKLQGSYDGNRIDHRPIESGFGAKPLNAITKQVLALYRHGGRHRYCRYCCRRSKHNDTTTTHFYYNES